METRKILLVIVLMVSVLYSNAISLKDAIKQNLISVTIKSNPGENSHYGKCISLDINNKTSKNLKIDLLPGMFLIPEDSNKQQMMVAEEMLIALNPAASKKLTINAFCTQMSKSSPIEDLEFKAGKMAKGHLLELVKLIIKNKFFSSASQNAIWCITDNNDLYSINSDDENENKILREFVSEATGKPLNAVYYKAPRSSREEVTFRDTIVFSNRDGGIYSLIMLSEDGEEMIEYYKDRNIRPNYKTTQTFSLTYSGFPVGKYYFRLTKNKTEVIYNKEIIIREAE